MPKKSQTSRSNQLALENKLVKEGKDKSEFSKSTLIIILELFTKLKRE